MLLRDHDLPLLLPISLALLLPLQSWAAAPATERRIDPLLRSGPTAAPAHTTLSALLERPTLTSTEQARLQARGVQFRLAPDGRPRRLGDLYLVDAEQRVLAALAHEGYSVKIGREYAIEPSTFVTGDETEAFDLWGIGPTPIEGPAGYRPTIAVSEGGIDIFHPHMFHADGGAWPWVDVDGDGMFTPGIDGVDANLDGAIGEHEALELLDYGYTVNGNVQGYGGTFSPNWDYLYLDSNGSGTRDYGTGFGYDEQSPGYGEAIFLPDDANGDGELGTDERIILLDTSVVKAIRASGSSWIRGEDLIEAPSHLVSASFPVVHGTSVSGVIVGGQSHPFRGSRALVPDADIVVIAREDNVENTVEFAESFAWAIQDMGAEITNHSWGLRNNRMHRDGSNPLDTIFDAMTQEGAVQVCSAGNTRHVGKHREVPTSNGQAVFEVDVPTTLFGLPVSSFNFDLYWSNLEVDMACTLQHPNGSQHIVQEIPNGDFDGLVVDTIRSDSDRGWAMLSIDVIEPGNQVLGAGIWTVTCQNPTQQDLSLHAYVSDDITYSQPGVALLNPTPTGTLRSPTTSDSCISVGGYPVQHPSPQSIIGELEYYSSHGPRIDGGKTVDVTAPVDAVVATPDSGYGPNAYGVFAGTSMAAPHVAAVAALLRGADPTLGPATIRDMIREGAEVDQYVDVDQLPDPGWGYGKLRGYRALTGEEPDPRPEVQSIGLDVSYAYANGDCAATFTVDGGGWDDESYRWDLEYDGVWNTDFEPSPSHELVLTPSDRQFSVRVDAALRGWIVAGTTLSGEAPDECFEAPPAVDTGVLDGGSGDETTGSMTSGTGTGTGTDADADGDPSGCGCRHTSRPGMTGGLWAMLVLLGWRRRTGLARTHA